MGSSKPICLQSVEGLMHMQNRCVQLPWRRAGRKEDSEYTREGCCDDQVDAREHIVAPWPISTQQMHLSQASFNRKFDADQPVEFQHGRLPIARRKKPIALAREVRLANCGWPIAPEVFRVSFRCDRWVVQS